MSKEQPSSHEMTILALLWDKGSLTARQVMDLIPDNKTRAYTSILSVMQVMEKKGYLKHHKDGVANVYTPVIARKDVVPSLLDRLVTNVFGGSKATLMQQLLGQNIDKHELDTIRNMIDSMEEQS